MKNTSQFNTKIVYGLLSIFAVLLTFSTTSYAAPVGCAAVNGVWNMIYDSVKAFALPLGGLAIVALGVQMLMDQENAHLKTKTIRSIILLALGIVLIYTAPTIIEQIATSTGQTLTKC